VSYLLLFPPSWAQTQPYLSLPSLTAFLRKQGHSVSQKDLNIEFIYWLCQPSIINKLYNNVSDKLVEDKIINSVLKRIKDELITNAENYLNNLKIKDLFYSTNTSQYIQSKNMLCKR